MTPIETLDLKKIQSLRSLLKGELLLPDDHAFALASQAWNLNARQHPALVIMAETKEDIIAGVHFAHDLKMGIGIMATGHGVGTPCNGGLLINTSRMRNVSVDPASRTATVAAGALWKDVIPVAHEHGLACLAGSASHVGVVGYTLGGGFGYLGRKYGLNAAGVTAAEVVTADGKLLKANASENPDLFWALKGSAGNVGIVTSLSFRLYPLTNVYGGALFYPVEYAYKALSFFSQWTANTPDELTAAFAFMNVPPLPIMPEALRGKSVIIIRGCYCGEDLKEGEKLFSAVREELGTPMMDTVGAMPTSSMDAIAKDPVDPMGVLQYSGMLEDLSPEVIETFVKLAGSGSPLTIVEFRQLGGALNNPEHIRLMGNSGAQFSVNALGATFTPDMAERVNTYLSHVATTASPYLTGEVFLNYMEVDPTHDRVRSAYTPHDWEKLVALKKKHDPANIFRFNRNIGPKP